MDRDEIELLAKAQELVDVGVKTLDEKRPNWFLDIDLDIFDIADPCLCVLGQVGAAMIGCEDPRRFEDEDENDYLSGYDMLVADWSDEANWEVTSHGFEIDVRCGIRYADLQRAWVRTIREKRGLPAPLDDMVDIP
jgi:hypothetical protein